MSFLKKAKRALRHYVSMKAVRKKIGLTGKSRHIRQIKRSLSPGSVLASPVSTSASTEGYRYNPRTLSQLTGGV